MGGLKKQEEMSRSEQTSGRLPESGADFEATPVAGWSRGWKTDWNVITALMQREMKSRFGRYRLGYLWALLEPMAYVGAFSILRLAFGREGIAGLEFPVFFAMGVIPFMLFSSTVMQSIPLVESNQGLFIYRRIRPYHCVLAHQVLEFLIHGTALLIILAGLHFAGYSSALGKLWLWGLLLVPVYFLFCLGLAFLCAMLGPLYRESPKIAPVLIRPLFLLSGIFIPAVAIPEKFLPWLWPNPVLQFIELFRFYFFEGYETPFDSMLYVFLYSLVLLALGVWVYRRLEAKVLTSGSIRLR